MNEIEKAIEWLRREKKWREGHEPTSYIDTATQALKEKAERDNGCVWCKEDNKIFHDGQHFHVFCSYCGKRLEEHHEDD